MKRALVLCAGVVCLLTGHALARTPAAVREAEQDADNAARHGDYPTAVKLYEDCLTQTPDDPRLLINLGSAYFQNGQTEAAIKSLQRAIQIAPKEGAAYRVLGIVHYWQKADVDAVRCLDQAIKLDPRDALAHKYLALSYSRIGDKKRASAESEQARRLGSATRR